MIINIPLFVTKNGRLQGRKQFIFLASEELFPSPPLSRSLPKYSKVMACHFSTIPSSHVHTKHPKYSTLFCATLRMNLYNRFL